LVLDEDLLKRVPDVLDKLIRERKMKEESKLRSLLAKTQKIMGTLQVVMDMYRKIERTIGVALLPGIKEKDWPDAMKELKKQLKSLPPST